MNPAVQFFRGFICPAKGFGKIFSSPKLMLYAVLPFWICFFLAFYFLLQFWGSFPRVFPYLMAWVPGLLQFTEQLKVGNFSLFGAIFQGLFWVFLIIFAFYFSYIILSIVGAPFYTLMTDRILRTKGARPEEAGGFWHWFYTTLKMFVLGLIKIGFFLLLGALLFVFSFFPVGMMMVPFLMALMIAYDCFDFSFECMNMSLPRRFRFFRGHFFAFLGLSLIIVLVGSVPGLFVFSLPLFIAGCADLFADLHMQGVPRNDYDQRIVT